MRPQTRLDLLADDLLADLLPLVFEEAETAADIDAVLRLRCACVIEEGWARPEDFPDGRERDARDDTAVTIVCRDAGELIGSTRLLPPDPGRPLLVEEEFGVTVPARHRVVEAGRVVIPRAHRGGRSHRILTGMFARSWLTARGLGADRVVGQATPRVCALYRGLGLAVVELGPARSYFGEERVPIEVTGADDPIALQPYSIGVGAS